MFRGHRFVLLFWLLVLLVGAERVRAAPLEGGALLSALCSGGYVMVMRHASSPGTPPAREIARPDNDRDERELDDRGIESARAMGSAFRGLRIPLGDIESSPAYRALQTLRYAELNDPKIILQLGEGGAKSQTEDAARRAEWLKHRTSEPPRPGTDTLLVTHAPNILAAFGQQAADIADGEILVFRPQAHADPALLARIKIQTWRRLATDRVTSRCAHRALSH